MLYRFPWLGWMAFIAVALGEALLSRNGDQQTAPPTRRGTRALVAVGIAAVLVFAVRAVAAITRPGRNVDEAASAMFAEFARSTGESLFSKPWIFRTYAAVYLAGSLKYPYTWVDTITSAVVALTGVLIGLTALSLGSGAWAGPLAVVAYPLGILGFEGLSSNKEPYANLFIAAYLFVRLRPGDMTSRRALLTGLCLGGAVVGKDQTVVLALAEPIVVAWQFMRGEGPRPPRALKHVALMATGALIPPTFILCGFALHGQLGAFIATLSNWAVSAGSPMASWRAFDPTDSGTTQVDVRTWFAAYLAYWGNPVTLAGIAQLTALTVDGRRGRGVRPPLVAIATLSLAMISVGQRWFGHYYMLAVPVLTLLFVLSIRELGSSLFLYTSNTMVMSVLLLDYYEGGNVGKTAAFSLVQTVLLGVLIGGATWLSRAANQDGLAQRIR